MSVKAILQGQNDKTPKLYLNDDSTLIQDKEDVTDKVKEALNAADKDALADVSSTLNAHQVDYNMHVTSEEKNKIANSIGLNEKAIKSSLPDKPSSPIAADAEIPWTWEQINAITCAGKATEYFSVGSLKKCTLSSAVLGSTEPMMRIIGIGQDADNTVTFQTQNCLASNTKFGSNAVWIGSTARSLCQSFYNACEAKSYIKTVSKGTCLTINNSRYDNTVTYNDETVWLPSEREMGLDSFSSLSVSNSSTSNAECTQGKNFSYAYYTSNSNRIKHIGDSGSVYYYWERSRRYDYLSNVCFVNSGGYATGGAYGSNFGLAPAFVIGNSSVVTTPEGSPRYTITQGSTDVTNKVQQAIRQVNPNILDNGYFINPVNQRGQTSYTKSTSYFIDRWRLAGDTAVLNDDGITITALSTGRVVTQPIELPEKLSGKTVTFSLYAEIVSGKWYLTDMENFAKTHADKLISTGVTSWTFTVNDASKFGSDRKQIGFWGDSENAQIIIYAAKLELGDTQTLAHQDEYGNWVLNEIPDYGEQLRRCQRYYLPEIMLIGVPTGEADFVATGGNFPVEMRTAPICDSTAIVSPYGSNNKSVALVTKEMTKLGCNYINFSGASSYTGKSFGIKLTNISADL